MQLESRKRKSFKKGSYRCLCFVFFPPQEVRNTTSILYSCCIPDWLSVSCEVLDVPVCNPLDFQRY